MEFTWLNSFITLTFSALVGFAVWYFQNRIETARREREKLSEERRRIYIDILEPFIRIWVGIKTPKESDKALKIMLSYDYKKLTFELNLMGSDEVVHSLNELMQYIYKHETDTTNADPFELIKLMGELLLSIRMDLGNTKTGLTAIDMLKSQIKDVEKLYSAADQNAATSK